MNRLDAIRNIRIKLQGGEPSIGGWLQIPSSDVAEIVGGVGFDWVAVSAERLCAKRLPLHEATLAGNTMSQVRSNDIFLVAN